MNRTRAEVAFALLFSGIFLALGAQMAFLQLWYADAGLTDEEIGQLTAISFVVRASFSILAPAASDRTGRPGAALALMSMLGVAATLAHFLVPGTLVGMLAPGLAMGIAFAGVIPISDAACWSSASRLGFTYRRPRAVGSFAFLTATLCVGAMASTFGGDSVLIFIGAAFLLAAVAGAWSSNAFARGRPSSDPARRFSLSAGLKLLTEPRFAIAVMAAAAIQSSHAVFYVYGSVHWRDLGFSDFAIGALWSWGVLAEIVFFFVSGGLLARLGAPACLALSAVIAAARWALMTLEPGVAGAAALQTLHAGSFALTHLAIIGYIARVAPPGLAASAQGIVSAVSGGLGMAAAAQISAWAFPIYGGGAYWVGAAFAAAGGAFALLLAERERRLAS